MHQIRSCEVEIYQIQSAKYEITMFILNQNGHFDSNLDIRYRFIQLFEHPLRHYSSIAFQAGIEKNGKGREITWHYNCK